AERRYRWSQRSNDHLTRLSAFASIDPRQRVMSTLLASKVVRTHPVMGTMASVHVPDQTDVAIIDSAVEAMWSELDRLEQMFSTFLSSSEISRINSGELHLLDASPEVIEVVDTCTWLEHASDGAFRARRPGDVA